jgi:MSHA biogenesis protein MshO
MKTRGFTLIEIVIAIAISSIVVIFAAMFIGAPVGAYQAQSRRVELVADASSIWPRMEGDLRRALPNSLRTLRNGNFVVIELLRVDNVARLITPPTTPFFFTAGGYNGAPQYLSVNNHGTPGRDAYTLSESMVRVTINSSATGVAGEYRIDVNPVPVLTAGASPRNRLYFVEGPVTYLCDEGQGTLRRYANYTVAANQAARATPGALAAAVAAGGGTTELVAQGLTACNFEVSPLPRPASEGNQSQTAAVRFTTSRNGDSVTLLHSAQAEYVP